MNEKIKKFMEEKINYILDKDKNVIPATVIEWGEFFEKNRSERIVRQEEIMGKRISTVFIGIDLGYFNDRPLIFETMVFDPADSGHDIYCTRYSTWQQAEEGHIEAVNWVLNGCKEED